MGTFGISSSYANTPIPLNGFISTLMASQQSIAEKNKNNIVNEISPDLLVHTDINLLNKVISGLFSGIVQQCENCCIRVSAKSFHNIVLFRITNINGFQAIHNIQNLQDISKLAEQLGGCISYNNQHLNESSFVLTFHDYYKQPGHVVSMKTGNWKAL